MARAGSTARPSSDAVASPGITIVEPTARPGGTHRRRRRLAGTALGLALGIVPALSALAVAVIAAEIVSPPSGVRLVGWWLVVFAASAVAAVATQELLRRHFSLVGLLRLALAFPADVPSRLGLAMRAGTIRDLQRSVVDVRDGVVDDAELGAAHVVALAAALQRHDRFTRGHCERVRAFSDLLAAEYGVTREGRDTLRWAALLHDVGKLEVAPSLLNKPGALDSDEWLEMRGHAAAGLRLGEPLRGWLGDWVDGIGQHHERYDGSGYPLGLAGPDISLAGRIVTVADSYETMTAARPYRKAMGHAAARDELVASSGTHFDPAVVRAMLRLSIRRMRWAAGPLAGLGDVVASRLIAHGHLPGIRRLDPAHLLRTAATSVAAVAITVSLGTSATAARTPTSEEPTKAGSTVTEPPASRGDAPWSADVPSGEPLVQSGSPGGTDARSEREVSPPPPGPTSPSTATPASPPSGPGEGPATPAVPPEPMPASQRGSGLLPDVAEQSTIR